MDLFVSTAHAQTASNTAAGSGFMQFVPLILIFGVMYFLLILPQQKKLKKHREKIDSIVKGDQIILQSGVLGQVTRLNDANEVEVEIAKDVRVRVLKAMIADVIRPEPVNKN